MGNLQLAVQERVGSVLTEMSGTERSLEIILTLQKTVAVKLLSSIFNLSS